MTLLLWFYSLIWYLTTMWCRYFLIPEELLRRRRHQICDSFEKLNQSDFSLQCLHIATVIRVRAIDLSSLAADQPCFLCGSIKALMAWQGRAHRQQWSRCALGLIEKWVDTFSLCVRSYLCVQHSPCILAFESAIMHAQPHVCVWVSQCAPS